MHRIQNKAVIHKKYLWCFPWYATDVRKQIHQYNCDRNIQEYSFDYLITLSSCKSRCNVLCLEMLKSSFIMGLFMTLIWLTLRDIYSFGMATWNSQWLDTVMCFGWVSENSDVTVDSFWHMESTESILTILFFQQAATIP